jgi:hypothetical protein
MGKKGAEVDGTMHWPSSELAVQDFNRVAVSHLHACVQACQTIEYSRDQINEHVQTLPGNKPELHQGVGRGVTCMSVRC